MENKWIGFSRSLWSAFLPVALIVARMFGVEGADQLGEIATRTIDSIIVIASLVLQFLHQRNPQPTSAASQ